MKQIVFLLLMLMMPLLTQGKTDEKKLLERIDYMIDNDQYYQDIKEKELKLLKLQAIEAEDSKTRLLFLDSIYHAYSAYRYDSAYAYMQRGLELAQKVNDTYYITLNQINQASILSVRGFYGMAKTSSNRSTPTRCPTSRSCTTTSRMPGCIITWNPTPRDLITPRNSAARRSIT